MSWFKKKLETYTQDSDASENSPKANSKEDLKIYYAAPQKFDDLKAIAQQFLVTKNVELDLNSLEKQERIRTLDFISGIMFACAGKVKIVSKNVYFFHFEDSNDFSHIDSDLEAKIPFKKYHINSDVPEVNEW